MKLIALSRTGTKKRRALLLWAPLWHLSLNSTCFSYMCDSSHHVSPSPSAPRRGGTTSSIVGRWRTGRCRWRRTRRQGREYRRLLLLLLLWLLLLLHVLLILLLLNHWELHRGGEGGAGGRGRTVQRRVTKSYQGQHVKGNMYIARCLVVTTFGVTHRARLEGQTDHFRGRDKCSLTIVFYTDSPQEPHRGRKGRVLRKVNGDRLNEA